MNLDGWQSMMPWMAAQGVQASGTPDGSNYKQFVGKAQSLVDQLYDSAPAVPLPVPFTGGSSGSGGADSSASCSGGGSVNCDNPSSNTTGLSPVRTQVVCLAQQELAAWKAGKGGDISKYHGHAGEWCADFVSWLYKQANYPLSPDNDGDVGYTGAVWDIGQQNQNFHAHPVGSGYTPKPGDIIIHNGFVHTDMVAGFNNGTLDIISGNWGNKVDTYSTTIAGSDIMGFVSPD
jgi:hypothetical protein